jgi:dihydroceramide fatty acyl 2-hydroxylase
MAETETSKKSYVSNKDETPRMFKNEVLESLTKVHPAIPLIVFIPIIGYLLFSGALISRNHTSTIIVQMIVGLVFWTFFEYALHKEAFHFVGKSEFAKKIHFLIHGIHHDYPRDSWRLVMPPIISLFLSFIIFKIFALILPKFFIHGFFAGFLIGYLCYDMSHYAIHHFNFKNKWFLMVRSHHYRHHYDDSTKNFGVSSPLWDYILGSLNKK